MPEFKGTPGRWEASRHNPNMVLDNDGCIICDVKRNGNHQAENRNLIATAPELLERLQAFVMSTYVGCSKSELNELRIQAESVINKALNIK